MLRDDGRVVVLLEESEQIVLVDIGLVAEADDRRHAHFCRTRESNDRHADAARLRRQRRVALDVIRGAERGAKIFPRVIEAVDVGPHQPHAVLAAYILDLFLALDVAGLGKAGRNQDRARNLLLPAFHQCGGDELGGNREHGDVDGARNVLDALVRLLAHDLVGGRIDRIDLALIAAVDQVLHDGVADLAHLAGRADHRDRVGLHDAVHVAHDVVVLRAVARLGRVPVDDDPYVGGGRAALGGEHWIQIHLRDFGEVADQLRDALDQRSEGIAINCRGATHTLQDFRRRNAVKHRQCVLARRGCQAERDVL